MVHGMGPVLPAAYHARYNQQRRLDRCEEPTISTAIVSASAIDVYAVTTDQPCCVGILVSQLVGIALPICKVAAGEVDSAR